MAIDPARLVYLLQNTGLQNKDNPLYQFLSDLIGVVTGINKNVNSGGGGGGTTIIVNENIIGFPPLALEDNSDNDILSFPGKDGRDGRDGLTIPGYDGEDGQDGISIVGPMGPTGPTGATGAAGINGAPGYDGLDGDDSFPIPGPVGPTGATGSSGINGIPGIPGVDGIDGEDGISIPGPTGATGATGSTGASGAIGTPGFDGIDGEDAFVIPGPVGPAGPTVPYYIGTNEKFYVPLYKQALFAMNIENNGMLEIDGFLIEVDDSDFKPLVVYPTTLHEIINTNVKMPACIFTIPANNMANGDMIYITIYSLAKNNAVDGASVDTRIGIDGLGEIALGTIMVDNNVTEYSIATQIVLQRQGADIAVLSFWLGKVYPYFNFGVSAPVSIFGVITPTSFASDIVIQISGILTAINPLFYINPQSALVYHVRNA